MEITQEHQALVETIVKRNPRFRGNEDLLEDFCSETLKRCYGMMTAGDGIKNLELYLNKVAGTAILEVLKSSGRVRKTKDAYRQIQEVSIQPEIAYETDASGYLVYDVADPSPHFEEEVLKREQLLRIKSLIEEIDANDRQKKYFELFVLKFVKELKQAEIAEQLGISQGEVSKRLSELAVLVSQKLA